MKIKKLLITLTSIATPVLLAPTLSSCGNNDSQCTISFSSSEGIKLSSYSPISITKGKYWSDLIKNKNFPTVSFEGEYTELGWCKVDDKGQYQLIENDFKIESNLNIKYVGYETSKHPSISIELDYAPETQPIGLEFAAGLTFKSFKSYYNIPSEPKLDGYTFEGYYDGESNPLTDTYQFPNKKTNILIQWNADVHTVALQTDGNGTITSTSNYFQYGKTWKQIKEDLEITPVPNQDYEFYKWVDKYGDDLSDDYVMKRDFTAKALFRPVVYHDIVFTCTDNTIFDDGSTKITKKVRSGITWGEIKNKGDIIPTTIYPSTCTKRDWYVVNQTGELEIITDDYIINDKTNVRFVAYNPDDYVLTVHFIYGPNKEKDFKEFEYLKGATFGEFRAFYDIPETRSYEGYEFEGYYHGDDKIDDTYVLPSDKSEIIILASFKHIKKDVYLTTNEYGKIESETQFTVDYGTKWKDIKGSIKTKANDGYVFDKWVFLDGTTVDDNYVVKEALNVKAIFVQSRGVFSLFSQGTHTIRSAYAYSNEHGDSVDIKWDDTTQGWSAREGYTFNQPSINNGKVHIETCGTNKDFRFITIPIKVSVPVTSHSTRMFRFNIDVTHIINLKAFFLGTDIQNTIEVFGLSNADDHPEFYANCKGNDDTRASDKRSLYRHSIKESHTYWGDTTLTYRYQGNTTVFIDKNDTDNVKWFDHYLEISFLIEGKNTATNGQQGHVVDAQFTILDV